MKEEIERSIHTYFDKALHYHSDTTQNISLEDLRMQKGYVASLLNNPDNLQEAMEYIDNLAYIAHGEDKLIQYSMESPDSFDTHPTKREPNSIEAILATLESQKHYSYFLEKLQHIGPVIPIGSLTYSPYYWITHPKDTRRPSDLDFEVVINPEILAELPQKLDVWGSTQQDFEEFCVLFQQNYYQGKTDFGTYRRKIPERNIWVDCHLIPENTLQDICNINLTNISETTTIREFRLHDKVPGHVYKQRKFNGEEFSFKGPYLFDGLTENQGVIFEVPHILYDSENDEVAMGYPLDKYLSVCNQQILFDESGMVTEHIRVLTNSIAHRLQYERIQHPQEQLSLSNALTTSIRMDPIYRKELDNYVELLL